MNAFNQDFKCIGAPQLVYSKALTMVMDLINKTLSHLATSRIKNQVKSMEARRVKMMRPKDSGIRY